MKKKKKIMIAVAIIAILLIIALILFLLTRNTKQIYTVSFDTNGAEPIASQQVEEGKTVTRPTDPVLEGYEFAGWYLKTTTNTKQDVWLESTEQFNFNTPITQNIVLEARWLQDGKIAGYQITLNIDGRETILTTDPEGMLEEPKKPEKEGYKFLGWYMNDEKVDFTQPFTQNSNLTAKWEKEEDDKKQEETTKPNESQSGGTTKPEKPTTNPSKPEKPTDPEEQDKPSKPEKPEEPEKPEVKKYTVTFKVDGNTVKTQTVEEGKKLSLPENPSKSGYTFKGWYSNGNKITNSTTVTKNMTVTGEWDTYTFATSYINNDKNSPNRLVTAYKNGTVVGITAIYGNHNGNSEYKLGAWSSKLNGVRIVSYEQFSASNNYKIELKDGTRVFASGN
jgi:uncharacterized repeat protein (TIGR02543 family)